MTTALKVTIQNSRIVLSTLIILAVLPAMVLAAPGPAFGPGIDEITGIWIPEHYSDRLLTTEGAEPPLNDDGRMIYQQHIAAIDDPQPQFDRTRWCAGPGMPRIMFMPYPFEIRADGDFIGFIYSWYRWHRVVDMSGAEPEILIPMTMGYPVGHWEGKTLVIETRGTAGETVLDAYGLPHSEDMVLTERLQVLNDGRLQVRFTINDEAYFRQPWEMLMTYLPAPGMVSADDVCPDRIANGEPAVRKSLP